MLLKDLTPAFLHCTITVTGEQYHQRVADISLSNGLRFLCPKCFVANQGSIGTHQIICWSTTRGAPTNAVPGPGRWKMTGSDFTDLTLTGEASSDSIALQGGCQWHGFVTNGKVTGA